MVNETEQPPGSGLRCRAGSTVLGGSGKWAGATGGGTFRETFNEDRTRFEVTWTGEYTLQ